MGSASRPTELSLLEEGCRELGFELRTAQGETLLRYLDLLYQWNKAAGLTRIDRADAVRLHLLDSIAAAGQIDDGPCIDLGSGAGLPGLVLAVVMPRIRFVLVESNRRKASFLLDAIRTTGLTNVSVSQVAVEDLPTHALYPTVISRAFRPPAEFLRIASRFLTPTGRVVLMLAEATDSEVAGLAGDAAMMVLSIRRLRLPGGAELRTIVSFGSRARGPQRSPDVSRETLD